MSIRFAAAGNGECQIVARHLGIGPLPPPANDQGHGLGRDLLLRETLRHFAAFGLQAAERARDNAETAFFAGRKRDYHHWMAICRTLDRRMAARATSAGLRGQC
jgi:hypothetical protein